MKEELEKTLIKSAIRGDRASFEELMNHYMNIIYNYILTHIKNSADALDVLQDVMLAAYNGIKRFKQQSTLKTWLISIARLKIKDFYRRTYKTKAHTISLDELDLELTSEVSSDLLSKMSVLDVLEHLPPKERDLIYLVFVEEMSYKEIELITGITVGTIKSRVHYLKVKLRTLLKEEWRDLNG